MKKLLLLFLALFTTIGTWATVTQPTVTTDESNPVYYVIQSVRTGKYANYVGASAQLTQVTSAGATVNALWYFVANGNGVSIVPAADPTLKMASKSSATADGAVWYTPENPYNAGTFCVSLTSGATANCWDDQSGAIGYWQPSASDYQGTSWNLVEMPFTKAQVDAGTADMTFALTKLDILARLAPLSSLSVYTDANVAAVRNAADETALNTALQAFETNISLYCRSGKYLVAGASACEYVTTPSEYNHVIQLESAGNGCFYLKGYKSEKYIGQVRMSTAVSTTLTPDESFYFENSNGYVVVKNVSGGGYAYIHNGGSGCVGWEPSAANTQHTIAEVELPAAFVNVTYHLMVGGVDKAQSTVECGVGDAPAVPSALQYPYTTYTYDVETITAQTTDVYATATFNMPFTASTDYANATWYYMNGHAYYNNYYISTNGTAIDFKTGMSRNDAYKWAFIGNPIDGIKVINKASGDGYYINGTNPAAMGTTDKAWTLKQQTTTTWSSGTRGFGLYDSSLKYLNCRTGDNNIQYWTALDQGSTFWVEEVDATTSDKNALGDAITTAQALVVSPGVPGYPSAEAASTLSSAIIVAQGVYDDAAGDYAAAYNTLVAAINTAKEAIVYIPRTDVYYTITSSRGSMVYDSSHDESVDADGNKFLWFTTSLDNTDVNQLWGFIEQDGKYYMYNVGKKQFATVSTSGSYQLNDKGTWVFSDTPAYVTFDKGINNSVAAPYVRVRATVATTETTYSMSISTSYVGPVITYDAQGDGGIPMMIATSAVAVDPDITAEMMAKVADPTPYRNALKDVIDGCASIPFGTGVNQYAESSAYTLVFAAANVIYEDENATIGELQTATRNLENAIAGLSLNLPAAGFYRIKGNTSGNYLAAGMANSKFAMTDAEDATTIFYFDGTILTNFGSGMCNGVTSSAWAWVTEDAASTVTFSDGGTNGGYAILSTNAYLYDGGTNADRGSTLGSNERYRSWYLTEVTSLPVETTAEGYTSFSAPVPVTIPANNCYAYIATGEETGVVNMTKVTGDVAANTGLIISTNGIEVVGPLSFDVAESGTAYTDNLLVANVAAANVSKANNYFFGKVGDDYVFTLLSGDDDYTLRGYKAYLNLSGSAARLSINWGGDDATGLSELSNEIIKLNDGKYYQNGRVIVVRNGIKYNVAGQTIK